MNGSGRIRVPDGITFQLVLCLRDAKQIGDEFGTPHEIEYFISNIEPLFAVQVINRESTVEAHVACILENGKLLIGNDTGIACSFCQHLIPLADVAANDQALAVFIQLIEPVGDFLTVSLDGEIGLTERNDFFTRVPILDDQITGVAGQLIIFDAFCRSPGFYDFVDVNKIARSQ